MLVEITPIQLKYLHFLEKHKIKEEKLFINQNQAFKRFGQANIQRWVEKGRVSQYKRPKCIEYSMKELLTAAETIQDYDM